MYYLRIGKNKSFCYDCNITKENMDNFYKLLSKKSKIFHRNARYYYWNDLKLIITSTGTQRCEKNIVNKVELFSTEQYDIRLETCDKITLPLDIFPPINKYNDIRSVNQSIILSDNIEYQFNNFIHNDELNTYEVKIEFKNKHDLSKILKSLNLTNLNKINEEFIIHDNNKLSISIFE